MFLHKKYFVFLDKQLEVGEGMAAYIHFYLRDKTRNLDGITVK